VGKSLFKTRVIKVRKRSVPKKCLGRMRLSRQGIKSLALPLIFTVIQHVFIFVRSDVKYSKYSLSGHSCKRTALLTALFETLVLTPMQTLYLHIPVRRWKFS